MSDREAFEAWIQSEWPRACLTRSVDGDGEYIVKSVQDNWLGWRAALLEAAEACEEQAARWSDDREHYVAHECAAAIRAMAEGKGEAQ